MNIPVSIIIPTLNEEKYLPRLLTSIKNQTVQPEEILVADAQSIDKTVSLAKSYGCRIIQGGPVAIARNNGVRAAKTNIMYFLDADSELEEDFLERTYKTFIEKELDVAGCAITPDTDRIIDTLGCMVANAYFKMLEGIQPRANGACIIATKQIHNKINGFDKDVHIGEDHDYVYRAKKAGGKFKFMVTEDVVFSMRRFSEEGRMKLFLKYLLIETTLLTNGDLKKKRVDYEFGKHE